MAADWTKLCRSRGLSVDGDAIDVKLAEGRKHRVVVRDAGDCYELHSIVARRAALEGSSEIELLAWRKNRSTQLVGFRVDQRGRLIGEAWVPKAGLTAEELEIYARRLATECDRLEYLLTGSDLE